MDDRASKSFATPEEAAAQARNDLIQVLETNKELNLGIDVATLRDSRPGKFIRYAEVDFDKLLTSKPVASLSELIRTDKSLIVPFVTRNNVIGIAEVAKVSDGWKITALGNKKISDDLNAAKTVLEEKSDATLYDVPNLQLPIFGVKENSDERYFLQFEQFSLKEGVSLSAFFPLLQDRARQFDKRFGDQVRRQKLVK
jgi:hypothetical protein